VNVAILIDDVILWVGSLGVWNTIRLVYASTGIDQAGETLTEYVYEFVQLAQAGSELEDNNLRSVVTGEYRSISGRSLRPA